MQKFNLMSGILAVAFFGILVDAQIPEKKESEKPKTSTVDVWRQAAAEREQTDNLPIVQPDESQVLVDGEETPQQIEKRILGLEKTFMDALKLRDAVTLNDLIADDFMPVDSALPKGQSQKSDKQRFIEWAGKNSEIKAYTIEKTEVRVYQTTAVVRVRYRQVGLTPTSNSDGDFLTTHVWVKNRSGWQAVSHHVTRLPPTAAPTPSM